MADFQISSLRGGQNEDPPTSIADDQCTVARNVEFWESMLGERRLGSQAIDTSGATWRFAFRVVWLHRHLPTTDPRDAQLWVMATWENASGDRVAWLGFKDTTWHDVPWLDPPVLDGISEHQVQGQTLHGKLFIAYKSGIDRLHVWDGGIFRRAGIAGATEPPTSAESGTGTFSGKRFYRIRWISELPDGKKRSEPGPVLTVTPSGNSAGLDITRPTTVPYGESITSWELEASVDGANFYRITWLTLSITTYTDTADYAAGYAQFYPLSDQSGNYETIPSVKYLTVEQDRLMGAGNWENAALASRVVWTPVYGAPGLGNDERIPVDTANFLDLDNFEGAALTGLSATVNGYVYATKMRHTYQLTRTGIRRQAYEAIPLTKVRGAIQGSLVEAIDQAGRPSMFMLDPDIGPCRIGPRGVESCGTDIRTTWDTVNIDAQQVPARALYFNEKKQVHWWVPTGGNETPTLRLVLHTQEMRETMDGSRRGWVVWDGPSANALAVCLYADNIDDNAPRSNVLKPFIGTDVPGALVWRTDTLSSSDNGTPYHAEIITKPVAHGNLVNDFECHSGAILAPAGSGAVIDVTLIGDFGRIVKTVHSVNFTPAGGGATRVITRLDDLGLAELRTLQVAFADPPAPGTQWSLEQLVLAEVGGLKAVRR